MILPLFFLLFKLFWDFPWADIIIENFVFHFVPPLWYYYSMEDNEKTFNHGKASAADKIALIGELEHGRRHCVRSAAAAWREEDDSDSFQYLIWAKRFQELRRKYMKEHFGELKETDWCLFKVCASLRQLVYEVCEGKMEELKELEDLIDEITGTALDMDLSDCVSCREDRDSSEEA